jgi:DNA-directed RNA polymerase subunit RPC12/RpoP
MQEITCLHCGASLLDEGQEDLASCPHCGKNPQSMPREMRVEAAKEQARAIAAPVASAPATRKGVSPVVIVLLVILLGPPCALAGYVCLLLVQVGLASSSETSRPSEASAPQLILEDWAFTSRHGYVIAEGEVTNVGDENLKSVQAVVSFYTAEGRFVTSATALIELNPILPGQTSPFRAGTTDNPAIDNAKINFTRRGGPVAWRVRGK